jgi:hypothetical protein
MGRLPQPTAMLDTKGSFIRHPEYKRPKEPKPKSKLTKKAPACLSDDQKLLWKELMTMLPPGVAFSSDKWALEDLVKLKDQSRKNTISETGATRMLAYLGRFGLTPVDRTRIQVEAEPESKLQAFLTKKPVPKTA